MGANGSPWVLTALVVVPEQELQHLGGDVHRRRLLDLAALLEPLPLPLDPVDLLIHPFRLQLAHDGPDEVLLRGPSTLVQGPSLGDVVEEALEVHRLLPQVLERELWPRGQWDVRDLRDGKVFLVLAGQVLEKAEGAVLLGGQPGFLQGERW